MTLRLQGRTYLVTGVLTVDSIAWHVAAGLQDLGAEVILTTHGRSRRLTERAAAQLHDPVEILELNASDEGDFTRLRATLTERWGRLDGAVHAIAAAPSDALNGNFLTTPAASAEAAFRVSAYSFHALTTALLPLLERSPHGGSVVGITFDATVAYARYDWMGVAKGALEAVNRYLALYLGRSGCRSNLVAAGPVETVAGTGLDCLPDLLTKWHREAPLAWPGTSAELIVGPVLFLLSDLARGVTGEILHADGGVHAVGLEMA
ncbi:SDR family oxidoreductase [Streptomyces sp. NPDC059651]|uniref:SDR family oxidoreductase n=1 Tax=unclassified Streptomyces TaxID=2593676 RepID=UPI000AE3CD6E